MAKTYTPTEAIQILKKDLSTSPQTEQKIQEAYAYIRREAAWQEESGKTAVVSQGTAIVQAKKGRSRSHRRFILPAAAAAVLLISTATACAAINGFFSKTAEQAVDTLTYDFQVNYELTPHEVTVTPGYIPAGYTATDESGLKYDKDGSRQNGISITVINAGVLASDPDTLNTTQVKEMETTTIGGMEADCITLSYDEERVLRTFDKRIYLFNPKDGYVGLVYGGNDLSMDELKKVAEGLTFTVTDEIVLSPDPELIAKEEAVAQAEQEDYDAYYQNKWETGVPAEQVFSIGDSFLWGIESEIQFQVTKAAFHDSAKGFAQENFFDAESLDAVIAEDGSLLPYDRITMVRQSDGTYIEGDRDTAEQRLLEVTVQAQNMAEDTVDCFMGVPALSWLTEKTDGSFAFPDSYKEPLNFQTYQVAEKNTPIYFDQAENTGANRNAFFFRSLEAGESLEYSLLFIVDADQTENLYLNFGGQYSTSPEEEALVEKYVRIEE